MSKKNLEAAEEKLHAERDNPANRVRSVNPCFTKGSDPSSATGFSLSFWGVKYWSKGCEIQHQFLSRSRIKEDPRFKNYALITRGSGIGKTHVYSTEEPMPELPKRGQALPLIPCQGLFREKDSAGTMAHRKILGTETQFKGCVPLERDLEEEQWISRKNTETLDFGHFLREGLSREEIQDHAFYVAEHFKILETRQAEVVFYRNTFRNIESWLDDQKTLEDLQSTIPRTSTESFTAEILRARPPDLIRAWARRLSETDHFEPADIEDESPQDRLKRELEAARLKFAAFLISRKLEHSDWAKRIQPDFPIELLSKYCSVVHAEITQTLPEIYKRCRSYLDGLTHSQREALEILYMNGFENPSQREAARALGISKAALVERVETPLQRLELLYPELRRRTHHEQKRFSKWVKKQRKIHDGCLDIESIQKIEKVTRFCPKTARALEMNPPARRLTGQGVARPKTTPQVPRPEMRSWLSETHAYAIRQEDPNRPYAVWKESHAQSLQSHRDRVQSRKTITDESSYKIPLSKEEKARAETIWVTQWRRLKEVA